MRQKLRTGILAIGLSSLMGLILVVVAITSNSRMAGVVGGIIGFLLIGAITLIAVRLVDIESMARSRQATRIKNVEAEISRFLADRECEQTLLQRLDLVELEQTRTRDCLGNFSEQMNSIVAESSDLKAELDELNKCLTTLTTEQSHATKQIAGIHRQLKVLRNRVPAGHMEPIEEKITQLRSGAQSLLRTTFESAVMLNREPRSVLTQAQADSLFDNYLSRNELLQLSPLIKNFDLLKLRNLSTLRRLYRFYRKSGYWDLASLVIKELHKKSELESDAVAVQKLQHEIKVFSGPHKLDLDLEDLAAYDPAGPILHMVGRVLPETQTGYTLRTQYTAEAQSLKGLPVAIVGQSGITPQKINEIEHYNFQNIDYYLLPGPVRNEVLLDEWLHKNVQELARLVRKVKPSVLHAHSDFFNALITTTVGKKYGIPTVYEARGFWEYSWLSRTITANGWQNSDNLFEMYGLPSAYIYRKRAEEIARILPDHVFTLADVMRDHILESAEGRINEDSVTLVPNAVESSNFPMQEPDSKLAAEIALPEGSITVGYISSIVEYEGIDTLLQAFQLASDKSPVRLSLLLVGDGDFLSTLQEQVKQKKISNVFFTGRVPHEEVLRYYGLIDIFVVPRKPSTVANLVTPLKPFEAFSTGRAVVLSDVGALREIAKQSGAVELFRAGDAVDLSEKIIVLASDPAYRSMLGKRAAAWVRNHRTWERNVAEYFNVYKKLGYTGASNMSLEAELRLHRRGLNAGELIDAFAALEVPPLTGWFSNSTIKQSAEDIVKNGWKYEDFESVPVASKPEWASYGVRNRSWGFNLHTWKFLEPLLSEYADKGQISWLKKAVEIAFDWISTYRGTDAPEDPMVWYDMGLALRVPILLNLFINVSKVQSMRAEATVLLEVLIWHTEKLHEDDAFNPNNNHGFYTAASQLHVAKFGFPIPAAESIYSQGMHRLETMVDRQFATDGVHLEHSPDYHRMLLASFERAINDGLINNGEIRTRIRRAAKVLGWMIQPDGRLVQFGDSPATLMTIKNATSIDSETEYILSDGERGTKPSSDMAVFTEGGYAFVRSPLPGTSGSLKESGYLAFNASFHSRAHKHADDLSIVWYDRGTEILVDAGRYGYGELLPRDSELRKNGFYYASPERQFVESTIAHNTLMMDEQDHDRRNRTPYGSGITECLEKSGVFDLSARARHTDYIHRRRLVYTPGSSLLIRDSVFSQSPESRDATIWFNIDGNFELRDQEDAVIFERIVNEQVICLEIKGPGTLIRPVRGQNEPLRGWRSRQDRSLEPVWSLGFTFPVETRSSVDTIFRLT